MVQLLSAQISEVNLTIRKLLKTVWFFYMDKYFMETTFIAMVLTSTWFLSKVKVAYNFIA